VLLRPVFLTLKPLVPCLPPIPSTPHYTHFRLFPIRKPQTDTVDRSISHHPTTLRVSRPIYISQQSLQSLGLLTLFQPPTPTSRSGTFRVTEPAASYSPTHFSVDGQFLQIFLRCRPLISRCVTSQGGFKVKEWTIVLTAMSLPSTP
jgi:hypothetical protein